MTRYGMTKERVITLIESRCPQNPRKPWGVEYKNACKMAIMAIEALEQEPCDDTISRQDVFEQINCWIGSGEYRYTNATYYLTERIKTILPVTPQPEIGRWVLSGGYWRCSECKEKALLTFDKSKGGSREYEPVRSKHCPSCGIKMEVEE